uniref:RxLR effector candidate protein n=1 Tax=Hyaloperonospora arabidopsidis (strain Emoy2) TaxID=559515 RepID=M4BU89_HYAAE|nr:RxLR effector candidate protein [Hyaloperonospora arabidopsidis Emoy2]
MVQVSLYCAIVRLPQCTFVVDIDTDRSVAHLKDAIKAKNAVDVRCDAGELRLFLAKKDGVWLRDDGDLDKLIQTEGFLDGMEEMRASWELSDPSLFGTGVMLGKKVVHVLVVLPRTMASPLGESITVGGVTIPVTSTMRNSPRVDFWKALQKIKTPVVADAVITLPEKTFILDESELGSHIYIRHCYPHLWDICRSILDGKKGTYKRLIILGTPGIGKTYFCFLVLLFLAQDGATVIYESSEVEGERTLFSGDLVIKGLHTDFSEVLEQRETFYVVDGVKPSRVKAKTMLVTSPRKKVWHKIFQRNCARLFMPVWSKQEIFKCRELLYSNTPVEIVEKRYMKWGGVARYVLQYAEDKALQKVLKEAITKSNLQTILTASVESSGVESDVSHRLLHFRVNPDFCYKCLDFASVYVAQKVFERLYERGRRDLIDFLAASHQLSEDAVKRGILFERFALSVLSQGGTFESRQLKPKDSATGGDEDECKSNCVGVDSDGDVTMYKRAGSGCVKLRPRESLFFKGVYEVTRADVGKFLQPASRNFEPVDAMAKPDELFQVTCAQVHPCKHNGLLKALEMLGNPDEPRLYFVVPPDVFEGFEYQDYHTVKGEKHYMVTSCETTHRRGDFRVPKIIDEWTLYHVWGTATHTE